MVCRLTATEASQATFVGSVSTGKMPLTAISPQAVRSGIEVNDQHEVIWRSQVAPLMWYRTAACGVAKPWYRSLTCGHERRGHDAVSQGLHRRHASIGLIARDDLHPSLSGIPAPRAVHCQTRAYTMSRVPSPLLSTLL